MTPLSHERAELIATLFALQQAFEDLVVRGLESTGPDDTRRLAALGDELARAGAAYLAEQVAALVRAVREREDGAPGALLRAQTAMRVLERVLSLDAAAEVFERGAPAPDAGDSAAELAVRTADSVQVVRDPDQASGPLTGGVDRALIPVLDELAGFVEGLVASGLTAATAATQQKLDASFREASRLKLLRLAAVLRYVGDECGRFLADSPQFSARRLAFFLNRTWLLCRGLVRAIRQDDAAALARLLLASPPQPVAALSVAVVGVHKRALLDGSAAFEFRMQTLAEAPGVPRGTRLVWSCVFGARKNVPAEAFLHLPQPQKFVPKILLEPTRIAVTGAAVTLDERGGGRLMLGPKSTVTAGPALGDWSALPGWDAGRAARRIRAHAISPLDLEVELQEDLVVADYQLGAPEDHPYRSEQRVVPLRAGELELDCVISRGPDGEALGEALSALRKPRAKRVPLYGLVHYEMARLVFQPLTALADDGPRHLMISDADIDLASLMKTLDFTT